MTMKNDLTELEPNLPIDEKTAEAAIHAEIRDVELDQPHDYVDHLIWLPKERTDLDRNLEEGAWDEGDSD